MATDVKNILIQAMQAVNEAGIEKELREVAFSKAVDILIGGRQSPSSVGGQPTATGQGHGPTNPAEDDTSLARLETRLKLDADTVRHVFDIENGELNIVVGQGKLEKGASAGTKQLALLVAAGRQGAGIDADWTPVDEIRRWAEHYKRLDSANFAYALKGMENDFTFRGSGRKRVIRLSRPGWEHSTDLVRQLGSGGEA